MGKLDQDFTTWKGNYRRIDFYIEDVSSVEGGLAEWGMSDSNTGSTLIYKTSTGGTTPIVLSGKTVSVFLEPEDTDENSGIAAGVYYHELRLEDVVGQPTTPAIGTVTLLPVILTAPTGS